MINVIGKTLPLEDAPAGTDDRYMYTDGPLVHDYLRELSASSFGQDPDAMTVGEMSSTTVEACVGYSNPANGELSMVFSFHHLKVDYANGAKWTRVPYDFAALKRILNEWALGMQAGGGWNALFWNNHDQPRAIDRFADPVNYHVESATMLATVIHLLRGTPYIYMGEEIGMTDPAFRSIEDYVDIEARNAYKELTAGGMEPQEAFAVVHSKARDNARTPMQWNAEVPGAGFTTGTPWLRPTNQGTVNVEREEAQGRILPYYRRLIALRQELPVISRGAYAPYLLEHEDVLAYIREHEGNRLLVLCNFSSHDAEVPVPEDFIAARILIGNYDGNDSSRSPGELPAADRLEKGALRLRPYEAIALLA